ncbi:RcnB family protein [Sodalis sp.]|uniref:RcnB family protein n=1 Tax=Sodalis sp. (in: enterobacteria) TaxID=1898979 RepID=UPI003873003E
MKKMNVMLFSGVLLALATAPSFAQGEQPNGGAPQSGDKNHNTPATHQASAQRGQPQGQRKASHAFHQGHALPRQYRAKQYQVDDWRARGLKAPPSGHRWVRVNNDYILIAITTGVITSIITQP